MLAVPRDSGPTTVQAVEVEAVRMTMAVKTVVRRVGRRWVALVRRASLLVGG